MGQLKMKLPSIKGIHLNSLPEGDLSVKQFLGESIPEKLSLFALNYNTGNFNALAFYQQEMADILPRVTKEVFIHYLTVSHSCLQTVFKGSANADRLIFRRCKIDTEADLDFSGPDYKTSYISFAYTGCSCYSKWVSPWAAFRKVAETMGRTSLKATLKTINVHACTIGIAEAKQIMADSGFDNVEVIANGNDLPLKQ